MTRKPHTLAVMACVRKLAIFANTILAAVVAAAMALRDQGAAALRQCWSQKASAAPEAPHLQAAIETVSQSPCAVAQRVIEVWLPEARD